MNVFEMIGEGGKCTAVCLRSLSSEEVFRLRIGRGVAGEGAGEELEVENMSEDGVEVGGMRGGGLG